MAEAQAPTGRQSSEIVVSNVQVTDAPVEDGPCAGCGQLLPKEQYSTKQLKKPSGKRCKKCVAAAADALQQRKAEKRKARQLQQKQKWESATSTQVKRRRQLQALAPAEGETPSEDEIKTAIRVCLFASANPETYATSPDYKLLRCALAAVLQRDQRKFFDGNSQAEYQDAKRRATEKMKEKQRKAALDRDLVNQRKLRAARLDKLKRLMEAGDGDLPLIADGAADDGRPILVLINEPRGTTVDGDGSDTAGPEGTSSVRTGSVVSGQEGATKAAAPPTNGAASSKAADSKGSSVQVEDVAAEDLPPAPAPAKLHKRRSCYTCKARYAELHHFYSDLCPACAELNFRKRNQVASLSGKVVLLTGGRVKIGFHTGLKVLRCGAHLVRECVSLVEPVTALRPHAQLWCRGAVVRTRLLHSQFPLAYRCMCCAAPKIVTTRFPKDCALRYAAQPDFAEWKSRLKIYGLDFRDIKTLERFCAMLVSELPRLDVIINNACQTIRRPAAYYKHLLPTESMSLENMAPEVRSTVADQVATGRPVARLADWVGNTEQPRSASKESAAAESRPLATTTTTTSSSSSASGHEAAALSSAESSQQVVVAEDAEVNPLLFPKQQFDVNQQQIDLRRRNSWLLKLGEIETGEVAEVFAINSIAPFVLNSKLKPLLLKRDSIDKSEPAPNLQPRFIINVSAMEGKFYRFKSANHPHTNMAKAALNMMTRTSASGYAMEKIYMNAVDTGWINDENPLEVARNIASTSRVGLP